MIGLSEPSPFKGVKAVFFDYDNTLVEFNKVSEKALLEVAKDIYDYITENFKEKKIDLQELTSALFSIAKTLDEEGVFDRKAWWSQLLQKFGIAAGNEDLYQWTQLYWSIASNNEPYPDAIDAIEYLKSRGYKVGLITNSDGEWTDKRSRIKKFPLIDKFDIVVIGGEGGINPKPHPQPFILACEKAGLDRSECVMIGDDPVKDCLAAKKAGLKAILLDRESKVKHAELYADYVLTSLSAVGELF